MWCQPWEAASDTHSGFHHSISCCTSSSPSDRLADRQSCFSCWCRTQGKATPTAASGRNKAARGRNRSLPFCFHRREDGEGAGRFLQHVSIHFTYRSRTGMEINAVTARQLFALSSCLTPTFTVSTTLQVTAHLWYYLQHPVYCTPSETQDTSQGKSDARYRSFISSLPLLVKLRLFTLPYSFKWTLTLISC